MQVSTSIPLTDDFASTLGLSDAPFMFNRGPFASLRVETEDGMFVSEFASTNVYFPPQVGYTDPNRTLPEVSFFPLFSEFAAKGNSPPRYWVIPLVNFLTNFTLNLPGIDNHPLRMFEPSDLTDEYRAAQARGGVPRVVPGNALIPFEYAGNMGFVEPVPGYGRIWTELQSNRAIHRITSVMVGSLSGEPPGQFTYRDWLPMKFLSLLGLASGTPVGGAWIELRDSHGVLCGRLHVSANIQPFFFHQPLISESIHLAGISDLLSLAAKSRWFVESDLEAWIRRLTRAGKYRIHGGRATRPPAIEFGRLIPKSQCQSVLRTVGIAYEERKGQVTKSIKHLARGIRKQADIAETNGDIEDAKNLREIATNVVNAKTLRPRPTFADRLQSLIEDAGFNDIEALSNFFNENPGPNGATTFPAVVKEYRDALIHQGIIDYRSGFSDPTLTNAVCQHIYDLIARLILRELGYDWYYAPQTMTITGSEKLDWVTPDTESWLLGYQPPLAPHSTEAT